MWAFEATLNSGCGVCFRAAGQSRGGPCGAAVARFDFDFLAGMMEHPPLVRNVALVGAMHAGKTAIMDCLVHATHPDALKNTRV